MIKKRQKRTHRINTTKCLQQVSKQPQKDWTENDHKENQSDQQTVTKTFKKNPRMITKKSTKSGAQTDRNEHHKTTHVCFQRL